MEPMLLKKKEVMTLFNLPEAKVLSILSEHGIKPLDFGCGRGNGLRWHRDEVMSLIDTLHTEAQAKSGVPRRRRPKHAGCVIGKSVMELYKELGAVPQ